MRRITIRIFLASLAALITVESASASKSSNSTLSGLDLCRLFPLWRGHEGVSLDGCIQETGFDPEMYDLFNGSSWEFPRDDLGWAHRLMECMDDAADERVRACAARTDCDETERIAPITPTIQGLYPSPEDPVAVIVQNAFGPAEGAALEDLKRCIQKYHSRSLLEHRPFAYGIDGQEHKGGNDCTFLGGFLQFFAPGLAAQVKRVGQMAWREAKWGAMKSTNNYHGAAPYPYKDPMKTGIRTSGHLSYNGWDELGPHSDSESLYTVLMVLSSPLDYDGGEIYMHPHNRPYTEEERLLVKPDRYSALVFLSDEQHGVQKISNGLRQTFGTEIWENPDVPFGILRPSPVMWQNFQRTGDFWNSGEAVVEEEEEEEGHDDEYDEEDYYEEDEEGNDEL